MCYLCRKIARTTWWTVGLLNWGDQFQFFFCFYNLYHSKVRSICQQNTSQIISLCTVSPSQEGAYQSLSHDSDFCSRRAGFISCLWMTQHPTPPPPPQPPSPPSNNARRLLCNNPWKQQWTKEIWLQLHLKRTEQNTQKRDHSISNPWSN